MDSASGKCRSIARPFQCFVSTAVWLAATIVLAAARCNRVATSTRSRVARLPGPRRARRCQGIHRSAWWCARTIRSDKSRAPTPTVTMVVTRLPISVAPSGIQTSAMRVHRSGERDKTQNDSNDTVGDGLKTADICSMQCAHGPSPVVVNFVLGSRSSSALPRRLDSRISRVAEPSRHRGRCWPFFRLHLGEQSRGKCLAGHPSGDTQPFEPWTVTLRR
jgi:hypothetical protein